MSEREKLKMISSTTAEALARAGEASAGASAPSAVPDPEVRTVAKRRRFSAAYKLALLEAADRCTNPGAIGALLRREGLYSSHLTMWRREREAGALAALGRRRGRKAKLTPEQRRIAALEARNACLERELEQARTIIGVQKKLCTLLGLPTAEPIEDSGSES
jgi:transposase